MLGAVIAREVAIECERRGIAVHYPVLCTAGYSGLGVTWHWGLSGSAQLFSATPKHIFENIIGIVPTSATIFHPYSLTLTALSLIYVPLVIYLMAPKSATHCRGISHWDATAISRSEGKVEAPKIQNVADAINNSRIIGGLMALMAATFVFFHFVIDRKGLDLNIVIFTFLTAGMILYLRPLRYLTAFGEAVPAAAAVLLQFAFYAGVMGMIMKSGLVNVMVEWIVNVATPATFPLFTWLVSGLVNLFIPSGGGQWAATGAILLKAGQTLGVPPGLTITAFGAGDAWTNLLQPFWALPLLGITGMRARDMFGYCILLMLAILPFLTILFLYLPY